MKRPIKKVGRLAIMAGMLLSLCLVSVPVAAVEMEGSVSQSQTEDGQASVTDLDEYENNEILVRYLDADTEVVQAENRSDLKEKIEELDEEKDVAYVQPNYQYTIESAGQPNDTYFAKQWALSNTGEIRYSEQLSRFSVKKYQAVSGIDINISKAWEMLTGMTQRNKVVVAVIDTGVKTDHEDLADSIWTNSGEIAGDGIDNDGNGYVDDVNGWNFYDEDNQLYSNTYDRATGEYEDDHGTHCAGTIAASSDNGVGIAGIAGSAEIEIMSVKALGGKDGSAKNYGSTSTIVQAIQYAEKMGANVVNCSFGGNDDDKYLKEVIAESNMLFVCAAGNDGANNDITPVYPASYKLDNVISVANIDCEGNLASTSDYGVQSVDLAAPGSYIGSTVVNGYSYATGTSMSAPMVTGVAALLYAYQEVMTPVLAKEILNETAKPLTSLSGKTASGGMLDAYAAVSYAVPNVDGPVITAAEKQVTNSYKKKLTIHVSGDTSVTDLRYEKGTYEASDFADAEFGQVLDPQTANAITVSSTGTYTIYAKNEYGVTSVKVVKVTITKPTSVSVSKNKFTLKTGKTYQLAPVLKPANAKASITYQSSAKTIASVSSSGKITAKKAGKAVVTIKTENGKTAKVTITVTK